MTQTPDSGGPGKPPREVGRRVVASVRRSVAERLAQAWRSDPERLATAVELGIVNQDWVDAPTEHAFTSAAPMEVVERFLERTAAERPSMLASLGLTALQVLGSTGDEEIDTSPGGLLVMFTDLEGFTSFTSTEGDDAARRLLAEHHQRVTPIIRARGGRVVKRLGDGLLLTFPTAESGVLAGLDLLPTAPSPLRLRAGAHHGDVVASKGDVIGHVVNVAARVTDRTPGGQLFVTEAVRDEAGDLDGVVFGRLRRLRLKGIDDRVPVRRVEDRRAATPALRPG